MQNESTITAQPGYVPIKDGRLYSRPDDSKDAEKNRFLAFVGNTITPEAVKQCPWMKAGGIQIHNHCLRYVRYFIQQARIVPLLEDQHDPVAPETVDPADKSWYTIMPPKDYVAPSVVPGLPGVLPAPLKSKRLLPGEQIEMILQGENLRGTQPRGIVELKTLKGFDYKPTTLDNGLFLDPEIWKLQRAIFPNYPLLPPLIYDVRALLDAAWEHTYLRDIVADMQESSQQFETYALTTVEQAHLNMNEVATTVGYAMRYTETDLVLLHQLGMKRRDKEWQQTARLVNTGEQPAQQAQTGDLLEALVNATQEERTIVLDMLKRKGQVPVVVVEEEVDLPSPALAAVAAEDEPETVPSESLPNPVLGPDSFDLNGERPAAVHHKTWEKWRRDAGIES